MKRFTLASLLAVAGCMASAGAAAQGLAATTLPGSAPAMRELPPGGAGERAALLLSAGAPPLASDANAPDLISLRSFAALIAVADESVLTQRYEAAIAEQGVRGAAAVFEPSFFANSDLDSSRAQNSSSEILQRAGSADYASRTAQLKSGISVKAPTGADVELSYNVARTTNSLQRSLGITGAEFRSTVGAKLTQPLLRNGGVAVTNAAIRLAEREQQVARETLRQVVTQRVMEGVVAYLNVQRAAERVRLRTQASEIAGKLLAETRRQQSRGLKSSMDLQDAESIGAQRRLQLAQAQQDYEEQVNSFQAMIAARERDSGSPLRARRTLPADALALLADPPAGQARGIGASLADARESDAGGLGLSLARRPELRVNQLKTEREDIRVEYARNQMLPELSLTLR
ncbi:TolC family protein, partial [Lacisediminimonas sp.]|uniref:TolC family protein n=1 Tax=Lacisediminimonas sp. TaxID=3060582 RepID=UPI00271B2279